MTVAGTWENEYNSRMILSVDGDEITGTYESTTGSVGKYRVSGWQTPAEPTDRAGQPVALAIEWHSIEKGESDPSWNWVSALGGQISIVDGRESLALCHLMIASSDFPDLTNQGVYVDKLIYHRVSSTPPSEGVPKQDDAYPGDPLDGVWIATDGTQLNVTVMPDEEGRFGYIGGSLVLNDRKIQISGFTDINATTDRLVLQSTSITAVDLEKSVTIAFGGWIELSSNILTLQMLTNHVTPSSNSYVQTDIKPMIFRKTSEG